MIEPVKTDKVDFLSIFLFKKMIQAGVIEKAVILVVENSLGNPRITKGRYAHLDALARRSSSGFVSTFKNSKDVIYQMSGLLVRPVNEVLEDLGKIKLTVLKTHTEFNQYGKIEDIKGLDTNKIYELICAKIPESSIIIAEISSIEALNELVGLLLPKVDGDNVAISTLIGYKDGAKVPTFPIPPVASPSWKVVGPKVVEDLSVEHPMLYITASKFLTRVDKVQNFDEDDIEENYCMVCEPICQYFREFTYYTGSSWKYGA